MFKVQILNQGANEIHAADYKKNEGDVLCCPDPQCHARMTHVSESQELATFYRAAHFRTMRGESHIEGCEAHQEEKDFKQRMDTIREALQKGKRILLSLNDVDTGYGLPAHLRVTFKGRSDPAYAHTELYAFEKEHRGNFVSQSVKKIFSLMSILHMIDKEGGPPAFNNVFFAWQGQVKSYEDLVCDGPECADKLFKDLLETAENHTSPHIFNYNGHRGAYGFPRLIEFEASELGRGKDKGMVFGKSRQVAYDPESKSKLWMKHAISISKLDEKTRERLLSGNLVRLIATPKVNATMARDAFKKFNGGHFASIRITWTVAGEHQLQVIDREKHLGKPLPARADKRGQLALL
jgi:hypothetical protein